MDLSISVSKGVFVFKNNLQILKKDKTRNPNARSNFNIYSEELWYKTYKNTWKSIDNKIKALNNDLFSFVSGHLLQFLSDSCQSDNVVTEIPAAAVLTGINMPDHTAQFTTITKKIKEEISPHVACLYSQDCQNIKIFIENMINQFITSYVPILGYGDDFETESKYKIKKSQLNFHTLQAWFEKEHNVKHKSERQRLKYEHKALVVILPDIEGFNEKVLQEFILIASSYINTLPFIFIFGIATSLSILHKILPYHVSSKVNIQYFNSQPSTEYLNTVLENTFFTRDNPFHLDGNVFNILMDTFLFYDLSVNGFLKKYKFAMLEHFKNGNHMVLCTKRNTKEIINGFDHSDCENIRRLPTFRHLVESESFEIRIKLLTDDEHLKLILYTEINKMQEYLDMFYLFLKCLTILVGNLPNSPLGKQIRELYSQAVMMDITKTQDYKLCLQLLQMLSKKEFCNKMEEIIDLIESQLNSKNDNLKIALEQIQEHFDLLKDTDVQQKDETEQLVEELGNININDRKRFKEKLLQKTTDTKKTKNKCDELKIKLVNLLNSQFEKYLLPPTKLHFHEIFFYKDLLSVKNHLIGNHRAAIHTALNDPHDYLQCKCCKKQNNSVLLKTMPDVCIAYKLHLEYGKMINLYDWLQGFLSIVDPIKVDDEEDDYTNKEIDPILQARFTLAVAELEFLGFVKSSKRKTDHVQRLTWGG